MVLKFSPYNPDDRLTYNLDKSMMDEEEDDLHSFLSYVDKRNLVEQFQQEHFDNHHTLP